MPSNVDSLKAALKRAKERLPAAVIDLAIRFDNDGATDSLVVYVIIASGISPDEKRSIENQIVQELSEVPLSQAVYFRWRTSGEHRAMSKLERPSSALR